MFSSTNEVHIFFKKGHLFFFFSVSCLCYELHSTWIFNVVVSFNCWYRRYHIIFHFIRQFLKFHEQFFKKKTSATHSSPNLRLFDEEKYQYLRQWLIFENREKSHLPFQFVSMKTFRWILIWQTYETAGRLIRNTFKTAYRMHRVCNFIFMTGGLVLYINRSFLTFKNMF